MGGAQGNGLTTNFHLVFSRSGGAGTSLPSSVARLIASFMALDFFSIATSHGSPESVPRAVKPLYKDVATTRTVIAVHATRPIFSPLANRNCLTLAMSNLILAMRCPRLV